MREIDNIRIAPGTIHYQDLREVGKSGIQGIHFYTDGDWVG